MDTTVHKAALETEKAEITNALSELGVQNPNNPNDWITTPAAPVTSESDPNDFGDRSEAWQERRGTLSALETRWNNINRALEKIVNGSYGNCEVCGGTIEAARLEANPAARTCVAHIANEDSFED